MNRFNKVSVIITAAGSSTRMGGNIKKEYLPLKNGTVISSCAKNFLNTIIKNQLNLDHFIITFPVNNKSEVLKALEKDLDLQIIIQKYFSERKDLFEFVEGGSSRQKSVFNALHKIKDLNGTDIVLIHDGARPFASEQIILNVILGTFNFHACVPGITPTDTIKQIDEEGNVVFHLKRNSLFCVQTPQGFYFDELFEAHVLASNDEYEYTDDTEIFGKYKGKVKTVLGDPDNIKITFPQDLLKLKE